jgi:hypothetical protein
MDDLYIILGVPPNATIDEIKERYRFLAHAYHPDKFANDRQKSHATEEFKRINEAYQTLSDSTSRASYDSQRAEKFRYGSQTSPRPPRSEEPRPRNPKAAVRLSRIMSIFIVFLVMICGGIIYHNYLPPQALHSIPNSPEDIQKRSDIPPKTPTDQSPELNSAEWFEEFYPDQKTSNDLLAIGITHTKNNQDSAINKLSIHLARHSDDLVSITFSAIHDQTFYFRRDGVAALQAQVGHYQDLRRRIAAEHRPDYREEIGLLTLLDAHQQQRLVQVHFSSKPRYQRLRNGTWETEGLSYLVQFSLPFPLEATEQFDYTEISINEAGVAKLELLLARLKQG